MTLFNHVLCNDEDNKYSIYYVNSRSRIKTIKDKFINVVADRLNKLVTHNNGYCFHLKNDRIVLLRCCDVPSDYLIQTTQGLHTHTVVFDVLNTEEYRQKALLLKYANPMIKQIVLALSDEYTGDVLSIEYF